MFRAVNLSVIRTFGIATPYLSGGANRTGAVLSFHLSLQRPLLLCYFRVGYTLGQELFHYIVAWVLQYFLPRIVSMTEAKHWRPAASRF